MLKTAWLFLKNNIKGYKSIFLSIVIFIFIINIVSIFLIGMSSGLTEEVTDNDNLNLMEVYPAANEKSLTPEQLQNIRNMDGVLDAFYTEGIDIDCCSVNNPESQYSFSIFCLDSKYLKYYGLPEVEEPHYFWGNLAEITSLQAGDCFVAYKNDYPGSTDVSFTISDVGILPNYIQDIIPSFMSFADPDTFAQLLKNCDYWYLGEDAYSSRLAEGATIHVIVPDVTKLNDVAGLIRADYSNVKVTYALERASRLPAYVENFVKVAYILLVLLLIFYFISMRNNLSHLLNLRMNGIRLFHTLGIGPKDIVKNFFSEFVIIGSLAWVTQYAFTVAAVLLANHSFSLDVYAKAVKMVLLGNVVLVFLSIFLEGWLVIRKNIWDAISQYSDYRE